MEKFYCFHPHAKISVKATKEAASALRVLCRILSERGIAVCDNADLLISLTLTEEEKGEGFSIRSFDGDRKEVKITASCRRGLLFGVGEWLRQLIYHTEGSIDVPNICIDDAPQMPWRAVMTCYHNQDNGYKYWDVDRERLYMEDMALWGAGLAMFSPLNMWQRNSKTFVDGTKENEAWHTMQSMPSVADELGLLYGMLNVPNDVFMDDLELCRQSTAGAGQMLFAETACACPSDPRAWKIILERRKEFFSKMARIDFLYIHPSDYGGCSCDECGPYIPTYLRLAKEVAACMRHYHPNAKVYIGTVLITEEGMREYVIPYLNSSDADWVDGIVYGMHGTAIGLSELTASIPAHMETVLYPEITMAENWGRIGAAPWVRRFAYSLEKTQDMGKECIRLNRWPNTSERMFGEQYPKSFDPDTMAQMISGAFVYSEGLHDEITKVMWLRYCWNPQESREDALAAYCRFYFGEEAAEIAVEAILLMEKISLRRVGRLYCPPLTYADDGNGLVTSEHIFSLIMRMKDVMPCFAKESWRYLFLELRARLDRAAFRQKENSLEEHEKEIILDVAEEIYQKSLHVNILPAGLDWNRERAAIYLDKLLMVTEGKVVAPVSPVAEY